MFCAKQDYQRDKTILTEICLKFCKLGFLQPIVYDKKLQISLIVSVIILASQNCIYCKRIQHLGQPLLSAI